MSKALKPSVCLKRFLEAKVKHNLDLYRSGMTNQLFEWESYASEILSLEETNKSLRDDNYDLMKANEQLKREIERLNKRNG